MVNRKNWTRLFLLFSSPSSGDKLLANRKENKMSKKDKFSSPSSGDKLLAHKDLEKAGGNMSLLFSSPSSGDKLLALMVRY